MSNFQIRKSDLNSFQFIFNVIKHEAGMQFKSIAKVAPCAILSHPFSFKVMLSQDSIHGVLQLGGIPKIIKLSVYCLIKNKSIKHLDFAVFENASFSVCVVLIQPLSSRICSNFRESDS